MKPLKKALSDFGHTLTNWKKEEPGIADFEINASIISDNKSKADILNNQFSSVFTQENLSNILDIGYDRIPATGSLSIDTDSQIKEMVKTPFYDLYFSHFSYLPPPVNIYRHPLLTEIDVGYSFNVWVQ